MVEAQLGPGVSMAREWARMQAALRAQASSPVLQNASSNQSDGSPGLLIFQDPTYGTTQTEWFYGPNTPGAVQTAGLWPVLISIGQTHDGAGTITGAAFAALRPDGSTSVTIGNKGFGMIDHNGIGVLTESESTFGGLKTPYMSMGGFVNSNINTWPATSATSWTTVASMNFQPFQPNMYWWTQGYAPTGVTGQFRMLANGVQMGTTWTASNNAFVDGSQGAALPSGIGIATAVQFQLQAQITAGSGTIYAQVYGTAGYATS